MPGASGAPDHPDNRHGYCVHSCHSRRPDASEQQPWRVAAVAVPQPKTVRGESAANAGASWAHAAPLTRVCLQSAADDSLRESPLLSQNGLSHPVKSAGLDLAVRQMHLADHLSCGNNAAADCVLSPPLTVEHGTGRASPSDWPVHHQQSAPDNRKRPRPQPSSQDMHANANDSFKWIHRDKLAKIENDELQAAGILVPRSRAPNKQRREPSQDQLPRRVESPDLIHVQFSVATMEPASPSQDAHGHVRSPDENAHDDAAVYFTSNGAKVASRIPVAKLSPAPIPLDFLERGSQAVRRHVETPVEMDALSYTKPRSRSASLSVGEQIGGGTTGNRRNVTDTSPKKSAPRKPSITSKGSISARPKTRSGPSRDVSAARPPTRTGDNAAANRAPDGDPPWMINSYKPDPHLPPDQQLLPTVARRLQQEKWEREGKFGDAYDTNFRPLNDKELLRPALPLETGELSSKDAGIDHKAQEDEDQPQANECKLKQITPVSPTVRKGSYSTMPKISDKLATGCMTSPRSPMAQQPLPVPQPQQASKVPEPVDLSREKGLCGCCVIM